VFAPSWAVLQARNTNLDILARNLERLAKKGDLLLVNPWVNGITLQRYFQGSAQMLTLPPLEDIRTHRTDLVIQAMMSPDPLAPLLEKVEDTLRTGHTVWVVGRLPLGDPRVTPAIPEPATDIRSVRGGGVYYASWPGRVAHLIQNRATRFLSVEDPEVPVINYENSSLAGYYGWKELPEETSAK
jgi:hypothetical protein